METRIVYECPNEDCNEDKKYDPIEIARKIENDLNEEDCKKIADYLYSNVLKEKAIYREFLEFRDLRA